MTVTSIAILSLKEGDQREDSNITAIALVQARVPDILASPGAQRCYWGRAVESEDLYYLLVDWATLQHHVDFVKNSGSNGTALAPFFNRPPTVYHAELTPFPPNTLSKPTSAVTEIATIYFPADISKESQDKVISDTTRFRDAVGSGCNASSGGWVLEDVDLPGQEKKGKAFIMMFGWDSIEAHTECVKTAKVQEHVPLIVGLGQVGLEMCHVSLTEAAA